jgi:hypothetical protein
VGVDDGGTYAGPRPYELPELIARQRREHEARLLDARLARSNQQDHALFLMFANLAWLQLRYLKACEKAIGLS